MYSTELKQLAVAPFFAIKPLLRDNTSTQQPLFFMEVHYFLAPLQIRIRDRDKVNILNPFDKRFFTNKVFMLH